MLINEAVAQAVRIGNATEFYSPSQSLQLQWEGDKFTGFISAWERHDWVPTPENLMADDWEICT